MNPICYAALRRQVIQAGYGDDIDWSERVGPPADAEEFAIEIIFVICNSGMKATIARGIFEKVRGALLAGDSAGSVFGHRAKAEAIDAIWRDREGQFAAYLESDDKIMWLGNLRWIGQITKYHAARNFGLDFAKPDRHLERIAAHFETTVDELCAGLAEATGDRIGTVDYVLWRAAERGLIKTITLEQDSKQGRLL